MNITQHPPLGKKLREARPLDQDYLMVYFMDGEVEYHDDGTGPSAYRGHHYAEGDSRLVRFGEPLDVKAAQDPENWLLVSEEDEHYGKEGKHPLAVHRKSKPNNADHDWNWALDHWCFLKLPHPMKQGARYELRIDPATQADVTTVPVTFDASSHLSEAVHVNIIGYPTKSVIKSADLYYWLGDGGERDYAAWEGKPVILLDVESGEKHEAGTVRFWKKSATEDYGRDLMGSSVWTADFTGFELPGRYRLVIEGIGASQEFRIGDAVYFEPFKTSVRGFYYMRLGEPMEGMVPVPRQPRFIPGKDPEGFTLYITDLTPWDPVFRDWPGDTWDEPHRIPDGRDSIFYKHRLPGNPVNTKAVGGHADAWDWDRHLAHVSIIYDMLLPFILGDGLINEDNLDIRESGNALPDIIDEARNEVDFWLNLRHGEAYSQGTTNPSLDQSMMFQAGTTTMAAWANAMNASMLAEAFRINGNADLQAHYTQEAITAFRFAAKQSNQQLDDKQNVGDSIMRGRDFKASAAAYLYNLTGDREWEDILADESVVTDPEAVIEQPGKWTQTWAVAAYLVCPHERHYPELHANMKAAVLNEAMTRNVAHIEERPSRRATDNMYYVTQHNLQRVMIAHRICDSAEDCERLEKAMYLEADWGLGRNPCNMVEMTGLGARCVENCYTTGQNDGTPGLHPGHTPYHNLDPWEGDSLGFNPRWFTEKCYPVWEEGWPHQEGHFNNRFSFSNSEFTPQQTMRGKMALYGYLYALDKSGR